MILFTNAFWWVWAPVALICLSGMVTTGRSSKWFPVFWMPMLVLCGISISVFLKSWGAGPRDGPSGLVILFAVFPTLIGSSLGFIGTLVLIKLRPIGEAWGLRTALCGLAFSGLAIALSVRSVMTPLDVTVRGGDGNPGC